MANSYKCEDPGFESASQANLEASDSQQEQPNKCPTGCPTIVHDTVCVQADVTISPNVEVGKIQSFCVGCPRLGTCSGTPSPTDTCTFTVSQGICVQIPLTFSAAATAEPSGIACGIPAKGPCPLADSEYPQEEE